MKLFNLISVLIVLLFFGCKDPYKTTPSVVVNADSKTVNTNSNQLHAVIVKEILPTANYTYLQVLEGEKNFWIAVNNSDAKVGETYFYVGGLLKENFESKALNRIFDELYLVGNLVSSNHGNQLNSNNVNHENDSKSKSIVSNSIKPNIVTQKGSIKISEIVSNSKKYEGKTIQIDGECTKINVGIMGKNWIHLKDGSKDDYDLVITSDELVSVGSVVTIKGDVVLNKDFGSGYKYDLIIENGVLVK
ncbi:MAG: GW dipeptide domain-containing protein [Flavobacteriaceae bacterium]|jgi:hypothetical protein|nr:GW dipeptide domain-containing protein [Flavobacteriaceae bacterium]